MTDSLMNTYKRLPVGFIRGEGAWLWDEANTQYLDAIGGIAVCALGHAHPALTRAISEQAATLLHTSNLFRIPLQEQLGDRLTRASGMEKAFFCNSGAEANEAAIKLARLYGNNKKYKAPTIVVMENSFHGRTLATLTATGSRKVQAGFEPLVKGFLRVPFGDVAALETVAQNATEIVAVMVEPIQGEGGIRIPDAGYLAHIRRMCDEHDWLMILDEIQTGVGRTGRFLAAEHDGILPDIVSLAKALGNGIPIGACLARGNAATLFHPGNHGTTFGGNPFACRAALTVLDTIEKEQLMPRAAALGAKITDLFRARFDGHPMVREIRGKGLMIGIELTQAAPELPALALQHGVVLNVTADKVIRLLPPYILTDQEAGELVDRVCAAVDALTAQRQTATA